MSLRSLLFTFALLFAAAGVAGADEPPRPVTTVHRLRNTAAADVARALTQLAELKKLAATIIPEPASNTIMLSGDPEAVRELAKTLAALDKEPTIIRIQMLLLDVPAGFAEQVGVAEKGQSETSWTLSYRETRMLAAAFRDGKDRDVLARPQLQVVENQTGFVQMEPNGKLVTARITPRILKEGIMMNVEMNLEELGGPGKNRMSGIIPEDGSMVIRSAKPGAENREILLVMTPQKALAK